MLSSLKGAVCENARHSAGSQQTSTVKCLLAVSLPFTSKGTSWVDGAARDGTTCFRAPPRCHVCEVDKDDHARNDNEELDDRRIEKIPGMLLEPGRHEGGSVYVCATLRDAYAPLQEACLNPRWGYVVVA